MPYRQAYDKFASATKAFTAGLDGAPVQFDQRFHQRQAYPEPGLASLIGSINLEEHIEHFAEFSWLETNAIVPYADDNNVVFPLGREFDQSSRIGILGGVR